MKRHFYITLVLALFTSLLPCTSRGDATASVTAPAETNGITLARKAFDAVNSRFDALSSLQYLAQRRTLSEGVTAG